MRKTTTYPLFIAAALMGAACIWQLDASVSAFHTEKNAAEKKYASCLHKIEQQAGLQAPSKKASSTRGVWPCWHQQISAGKFAKDGAMLSFLASPTRPQGTLYLGTLAVFFLAGVAGLKQRQRHAYQACHRADPKQ